LRGKKRGKKKRRDGERKKRGREDRVFSSKPIPPSLTQPASDHPRVRERETGKGEGRKVWCHRVSLTTWRSISDGISVQEQEREEEGGERKGRKKKKERITPRPHHLLPFPFSYLFEY